MSIHVVRMRTVAAFCALLAVGSGCAPAEHATEQTVRAESAAQGGDAAAGESAGGSTRGPARNGDEQDFLDDLTAFGLPTEMTEATTVEVGIGICRSISDGSDPDTILDHLRPLTSAIAAQDPERDTAEVGRAIIDASRAHLCN